MKYLMLISILALTAFGCKKKDDVSFVVKASYPTVTLTGAQFYSIPTGGSIPAVSATAYDSVLNESYTPKLDASGVDNTTPGLYVVPVKATNKYGYIGQVVVYIAVTDINPAINLSGNYKRTSNNAPVVVTRVANGLYSTNDVGGAPTLMVTAYFAQLDNTTIDVPVQPTIAGDLYCSDATLQMVPGDTSFTYIVQNASFGKAPRTFKKQ